MKTNKRANQKVTYGLPTRRELLHTLMGSGFTGVGLGVSQKNQNRAGSLLRNPPAEPVIEWNARLFSPDLTRFSLHPKAVYQPDGGCNVLIDHLAEPHLGTGVELADVLELTRFPNVYMKLSRLDYFAKDEPYFESALPFTRRVIREFGPDRVVWGSGSPAIVDKHMTDYAPADRAKVKGGNLRKLLNWN